MKKTFFGRRALMILMIIFFFVPFAMRGARHAVQDMKNDVRDWLPSTYDETGELHWFRDHFLGEQFVVVSWDGCHGDESDALFRTFMAKLLPSKTPSEVKKQLLEETGGADSAITPEMIARVENENPLLEKIYKEAEVHIDRPNFIGDELGLYTTSNDYFNWGSQNEKWLRGFGGVWYYITPTGDLYRWEGVDAPVAALGRSISRWLGNRNITGELIKSFGATDGPWYYDNPRRLRMQLFKTVSTGPGVLESLVNEDHGVLRNTPEEAKERLTGTMLGPDGKQTCIVLTLTDGAKRDLHQVLGRAMLGKPLGRLYEIWWECGSRPKETLRLGGPPVDNVAIDEEGTITLVRLLGLSVGLGLTLSYACFRSISATMMVFFVGGISAVTGVAFVWWLGSSMDAIMMSMPSMVYVLGLSGAVHIVNYYHEAARRNGLPGAPEAAVSHGWKPALLCNITTAIGLVSLCTSEIVPIRKFGIYSAIAVMVMLVFLFTYLPAALELWPQKVKRREETIDGDEETPWLERYLAGFWGVTGRYIIGNHALVAISCTLFVIATGYGVTRIQTSVNLMRMFDPSSKIIHDYQWLEANLGRLVPMEVVLKVDKNTLLPTDVSDLAPPQTLAEAKTRALDDSVRLNFLGRLEMAAYVQNAVEQRFGPEGEDKVGRALSAVTFAPILPPAKADLSTFMERRATNKKLEENRDRFLASDYLRLDQKNADELWRISVRLAASKKVDYGGFVGDLRAVVEPVLQAYGDRERVMRAIGEERFEKNASGEDIPLNEASKYVSTAGANVLVVGDVGDGTESDLAAEKAAGVNRERLRLETLVSLLRIARMKVTVMKALPAEGAEALAKYDGVVAGRSIASQWDSLAARHVFRLDDAALPAEERSLTKLNAVYTGVVPIVYKAQKALLESLIASSFWSFVTITPLMMFVARSFSAGAVAMLPNVLPVFVIFGMMGWLNVEVDVGSMMTASIALGVAVDDTIHYLSWFREELDECGDRKQAILRTYQRCATPTFQAALISGLGLSIFAFSTFTPTQRFGYLMLTILWAGVAAELIYFPALLAGPLGWAFKPRKGTPGYALAYGGAPTIALHPEPESTPDEATVEAPAVVKFSPSKLPLKRHDPPHEAVR